MTQQTQVRTRIQGNVILAVFARSFASYFSGLIGYLFIVAFVVVSAILAFSPQFFTNNLANLDQLNVWFPLLLLFIVPAITMSSWADERKLGTDELLFTLPARDIEILLGKYLSVLAVWSVVILFSLTHLAVLGWYADPDWSMLLANYFGYWLAGAAMLSAGMFASVLTASTTVAFVLGVLICAVPVFVVWVGLLIRGLLASIGLGGLAPSLEFFTRISLGEQFREFGMGLIPLDSVLYFVALTVFMLYLNLVFITKRHWSSGQERRMGLQFFIRSVSLAAILISLSMMASHATIRLDMTQEKLYTLSPTTREAIRNVTPERPVTIRAYISPQVPREMVPVRQALIGLLRQYDQMGGGRIEVSFVDVEPFSREAEEARLEGITPRRMRTERDGRRIEENVFMGVVVTSTLDEVVIPFVGPGTPIEYELTRSLGTVSDEKRLTVGILATDARVMSAGSGYERIVDELKKQYVVEEVTPDDLREFNGDAKTGDQSEEDGQSKADESKQPPDVLIAVLPSSLTQDEMTALVNYVGDGHPTLIFDDPFPYIYYSSFEGIRNAPRQPKPSPQPFGMNRFGQPPPERKADDGRATSLVSMLGISWQYDEVVWDLFNPHPEFYAVVPPEFIFVSNKSGTPTAINPDSPITSGLQELMLVFSGTIVENPRSDLRFTPLLKTGPNSGLIGWDELTRSSFNPFAMQPVTVLNPNRRRGEPDEYAHILAARIISRKAEGKSDEGSNINAVYVADIDLISDWFFEQRELAQFNFTLDNVTFVLNAVDVLAGDDTYLELRKRRPKLRTLVEVERQTDVYRRERVKEREKAEREAEKKLEEARERFRKRREEIRNDESLDSIQKAQLLQLAAETEERRLEIERERIEREKNQRIEEITAREKRQIREIEDAIRYRAVMFPPIPAILVGAFVFFWRLYNERREIAPDRMIES